MRYIFFFYNYYSLLGDSGSSINGLGILWSLAVEEHFYLIWPLIFVAIARGWAGVFHLIALLGAILLWRYIRVFVFDTPEWPIYVSTDSGFDSLLYGCLLALEAWRGLSDRIFRRALPVT